DAGEASGAEPELTATPEGELEATGQDLEAEEERGVMNAPLADEAELPARDGLEPAAESAAARSQDADAEASGSELVSGSEPEAADSPENKTPEHNI
ncbi:MAG TPA: hypothetical protein VFP94_09600, partial [Terriglobales bacterium]|nr:hypothetical protein [Terriglobales bacterium]